MKNKSYAASPFPARQELDGLPKAPRLILETARMMRYRVRRQEATDGVMSSHAARLLMAHLAVAGESNQLALARQTKLSCPTVSVVLRQMEESGLVRRVADAADRRVVRVTLTEAGETFDREHLMRITENENRAVAGFSKEEEEMLSALLLRVQKNLEEA